MIDPQFKYVKAGDWIWTIKTGWEKVINRNTETLLAQIETDKYYYGLTGKWANDVHVSAWTYNPFDKKDFPPCEFKKDEIIAVRDADDKSWQYDKFIRKIKEGRYNFKCVNQEWRYARKLTLEEKGE